MKKSLKSNNETKDTVNTSAKRNKIDTDEYIKKAKNSWDIYDVFEAITYAKKHIEIYPEDSRAWRILMDAYYECGEFNLSLIYCNKLLESGIEDAELFERKAFLLNHTDDVDEALEYYNKAIKLKPDFYYAICDKAKLLAECGCYKEALTTYKQAILVDPKNSEAYLGAAFAYNDLGDKKKAAEFSAKAHDLDPEDEFCKLHSAILRDN